MQFVSNGFWTRGSVAKTLRRRAICGGRKNSNWSIQLLSRRPLCLERKRKSVLTKIIVFCSARSGWVIEKLKVNELKTSKYSSLRAGCYIATPPEHETQRKSVLKIKNMKDNLCFIYSILAALFPAKHIQERPPSYRQHMNSLHINPQKMPMAIADIPVFEKNNHLKINVFTNACSKVYPAYI